MSSTPRPPIGAPIVAMIGTPNNARPRRARVTKHPTEIGAGLAVVEWIDYEFEGESAGRIASSARVDDEGLVWARGWDEETAAALAAAYTLHDAGALAVDPGSPPRPSSIQIVTERCYHRVLP